MDRIFQQGVLSIIPEKRPQKAVVSMAKKIRKASIRIVVFLFIFVFVIYGILAYTPVGPIAAIGLEYTFIKWDIRNPYVDAHFSGWKPAFVEDTISFYIPEGWSIDQNNGVYTIRDASGSIWAYGTIFGLDESRFSGYQDFMESITSVALTELEFEPFIQFPMMDGSDIDKLTAYGADDSAVYFCVQLFIDTQAEFAWFVDSDLSKNADQYDIAEAIVYSYAFGGM